MPRVPRMVMLTLAVAVSVAPAMPAGADPDGGRDACARGTRWRGHRIDLDVKDASLPDLFRFLSEVGNVNVVVADDVVGRVTMRLVKVPWDQALCTIAATKQLDVTRDGNIFLIRRR